MLQLVGEIARRAPHRTHKVVGAARSSQAHARHFLWREAGLDAARLHYSPSVVRYLEQQATTGRQIVLATGSTQEMADAVAAHVGVFTQAIGALPPETLTGDRKAARLVDDFGLRAFDYAGNSSADLAVWRVSRAGIVCNAPARVLRKAMAVTDVIASFDDRRYRGPGLQSLLSLIVRN